MTDPQPTEPQPRASRRLVSIPQSNGEELVVELFNKSPRYPWMLSLWLFHRGRRGDLLPDRDRGFRLYVREVRALAAAFADAVGLLEQLEAERPRPAGTSASSR